MVRFAEWRQSAGLTQGQLAERLQVSQSTISGWERGHHFPPQPLFRRILLELTPPDSEVSAAILEHGQDPETGLTQEAAA